MSLVECVPNVSEGRRADVIAAIAASIAAPGVHLLDQSSDPSHNRSVYTFAGEASAVRDAAQRLVRDRHRVDRSSNPSKACTLASARSTSCRSSRSTARTMDECVRLAKDARQRACRTSSSCRCTCTRRPPRPMSAGISQTSGAAASNGLAHRMKQPEWRPDFGPDRPHPSAGATAIGARPILIAYNINLATDRLERGEADCVGHPDQRRRSAVSSRRWASSSNIAASCRCR